MDKKQIMKGLRDIVSPYTEEKAALDHLGEDTDFMVDLKVNSANLVDIVLDVEERFGITIDNDSMSKMLTVKATIEIIEEKLRENAGQ